MGLTVSHLDPRMSRMTVKPFSRTSSLATTTKVCKMQLHFSQVKNLSMHLYATKQTLLNRRFNLYCTLYSLRLPSPPLLAAELVTPQSDGYMIDNWVFLSTQSTARVISRRLNLMNKLSSKPSPVSVVSSLSHVRDVRLSSGMSEDFQACGSVFLSR